LRASRYNGSPQRFSHLCLFNLASVLRSIVANN
jgi:hypothetical protein